jgi:hypothetical protein
MPLSVLVRADALIGVSPPRRWSRSDRLAAAVATSSAAAITRLVCMPGRKVSRCATSAPKTAIASAQPSWRRVLSTPLAVPARSAGTPPTSSAVRVGTASVVSTPTAVGPSLVLRCCA